MKNNPLLKLRELGQGMWLDFLSRDLLDSGDIVRLIREDGLSGITSNPAIFQKAIGATSTYDAEIKRLARSGLSTSDIYDNLVVHDIQLAADFLRPLFDRLDGKDGFVSLEVSPLLAHDTVATLGEARRLWKLVERPNVFIKVPGTWEGLSAFRELVSEGININVTLLFGVPRYRAFAEAYLDALEVLVSQNRPIARVASVASFFLSRIDVLVDGMLDKMTASGGPDHEKAAALRGEVAIASAKLARAVYQEIIGSERYRNLVAHGARPQRLLWASTGRKNPAYSDLKYVEPLIGSETVNTMPLDTITAYRDHGNPEARLDDGTDEARQTLDRLAEIGIDLNKVAQQLEDEGIQKFVEPFNQLLETIDRKRVAALG
ncbi:transaldolase [Geomesophilobacter sediminis]|uniref:Transaldolase n=1 Tax=Geomesophilobacter sediminis TaxID=2798584 RepID=A0A8J7JBB6_9BACT|nr:transaldolase [Geomesophilobacter sediminis]MBJ6723848.1 transaldolase [Geomesophilobacter sediminis]